MTKSLTAKQKRFVQEYMLDGNATQAAIRAGYSEATAHVQGPRLLGNVRVCAALAELQDATAEKHEVTVESIAAELDDAAGKAAEFKQAGAIVAALTTKAKLYGLIVNKHENVNELTDIERKRRIHELLDARDGARAADAPGAGAEGSRPEPAQPIPPISEAAPVSRSRH